MTTVETKPLFVVRYWIRKSNNPREKADLHHAVFYNEKELMELVKNIQGNYYIYEVGSEYKSKTEIDKQLEKDKIDTERDEYERLKKKFEQ